MKKIYILIFVFNMLFLTAFGDVGVPICRPGESPSETICNKPSFSDKYGPKVYTIFSLITIISSLIILVILRKKNINNTIDEKQ